MCTERKATGEYVLACCLFATMAYTKTTSRVRLAYSGFRLRTALFFNPHVQVS